MKNLFLWVAAFTLSKEVSASWLWGRSESEKIKEAKADLADAIASRLLQKCADKIDTLQCRWIGSVARGLVQTAEPFSDVVHDYWSYTPGIVVSDTPLRNETVYRKPHDDISLTVLREKKPNSATTSSTLRLCFGDRLSDEPAYCIKVAFDKKGGVSERPCDPPGQLPVYKVLHQGD